MSTVSLTPDATVNARITIKRLFALISRRFFWGQANFYHFLKSIKNKKKLTFSEIYTILYWLPKMR